MGYTKENKTKRAGATPTVMIVITFVCSVFSDFTLYVKANPDLKMKKLLECVSARQGMSFSRARIGTLNGVVANLDKCVGDYQKDGDLTLVVG